MRATESMWYRDSLFSINRNKLEFAKTIQQQSSGKRINTFSDDPAGSSFVVGLNDRKSQITQFITNVDRTQTLLSNTETAISQIQNVLNSAVTTLSQATTGTSGPEERALLAVDISEKKKQLLDIANTRVMDRYVFSGTNIDTVPYTETAGVVTYNGNDGLINSQVGASIQVTTNIPGSELFNDGSGDLFTFFENVQTHMTNNDSAALKNDVTRLGEIIKHISTERGIVGNRIAETTTIKTSLKEFSTNVTATISSIEDANMAEVISNLSKEELGLRVALQATARIQGTTLFDYLG